MVPQELIDQVKAIRTAFEKSVAVLERSAGFQSLLGPSGPRRDQWNALRHVLNHPRFRRPVDGRIVCAIVGASNHGKTTTLEEMFPALAGRGWLVTESTDTTSQALRIEYAPPDSPELGRVRVNSWDLARLNRLADAARGPDERMGISHSNPDGAVVIDGAAMKVDPDERRKFKFPLVQELRPLPGQYDLTPEQAHDPAFIRALTTKEPSERIDPGPLLTVGGRPYNALQLRAAVKDVTLHDPFDQVVRWVGGGGEAVNRLVFVDTPGLGTAGSAKDEVLVNCLANKSQHVVLQLLEDDELDVVLHLVLCGGQSTFGSLWDTIVGERGRQEIEALIAERLLVVVTGVAASMFENEDNRRKWDAEADVEGSGAKGGGVAGGDPFALMVRDNILEKMVRKGRVRPAGVVFIDSLKHAAGRDPEAYRRKYEQFRPYLRRALEPGGVGHESLRSLGLLPSLAENVDALCDPSDRGQGYLIRRIVALVREKGPALFLQRHLLRTDLLNRLRELRSMLSRCFDDRGRPRQEAVREALRECLDFLTEAAPEAGDRGPGGGPLAGIEAFAREQIDPALEAIDFKSLGAGSNGDAGAAPGRGRRPRRAAPRTEAGDWVRQAFERMCTIVEDACVERSGAGEAVAEQFRRYFRDRAREWAGQWGYQDARLPHPTERAHRTDLLVLQGLRFHSREMLFQLVEGEADRDLPLEQSEAERAQTERVLAVLGRALATAESLCRQYHLAGAL